MEFGTGESPVSADERDPFVVTREAEAWAEKYLAADGNSLGADGDNSDLMRDVESDKVNHERLETEVRRLLSTIDVEGGFCAKCRHLYVTGRTYQPLYGLLRVILAVSPKLKRQLGLDANSVPSFFQGWNILKNLILLEKSNSGSPFFRTMYQRH